MVLIESGMALASFLGNHRPTLLILDGGLHPLDTEQRVKYLKRLSDPTRSHQTILTDVGPGLAKAGLGWNVIEL